MLWVSILMLYNTHFKENNNLESWKFFVYLLLQFTMWSTLQGWKKRLQLKNYTLADCSISTQMLKANIKNVYWPGQTQHIHCIAAAAINTLLTVHLHHRPPVVDFLSGLVLMVPSDCPKGFHEHESNVRFESYKTMSSYDAGWKMWI